MNINKIMKQAQAMQKQMNDMQQKMAEMEMVGTSGGGMVSVTLTGKGDAKKVKIDPKLADPAEIEMLEDLIVAAINDAKNKTERLMNEEMAKVTGGLNLPPGMKLPF